MPIFRLTKDLLFPPPELADPDGLLAVGGDLSEARLLLAYRMGIFPWYEKDAPILWWSPDPRLVLFPGELHISQRLARVIKSGRFSVTLDTAFNEVIEACAEKRHPGREDTWIVPAMIRAYCRLHRSGYAHSVECWRDAALVGGLYGVSLGRCFFGESMFSTESNASKVALAALTEQLKVWDFELIDCQVSSPHLLTLGAREISREEFLSRLDHALNAETRVGKWRFGGKSGTDSGIMIPSLSN